MRKPSEEIDRKAQEYLIDNVPNPPRDISQRELLEVRAYVRFILEYLDEKASES